MKKSGVTIVLLLAAAAMWAQQPQAQPGAAGQQGAAQPQQKKEIKDPAEYNAYVNAIQATDPNAKAAGLEAFLNQYPNSVVKEDALEALMSAYQQAQNGAKLQDAATRLLQVDPCNVRGLALLAYLTRTQAEAGQNSAANAQAAGQYGNKGVQCLQTAPKPEGMSDADFTKLKSQLVPIFEGSAGFAALQSKDYPNAAQHLEAAVKAQLQLQPAPQPGDLLRNVYPLAVAYLEQQPPNPIGLYYAAAAVNLAAGSPAQAQINNYAHSRYRKYHGGDDGYQELVAQARSSPLPPAGFTVTPAPTPAEQAAKMMQTMQIKDMQFADFQFILTSGNQQAAEQLWSQIKDKPIAMEAKLISSSPTKLTLAGSGDDIDANKADLDLTMKAAIPAKAMNIAALKDGSMVQFQGTPRTYDPNPFMMHMEDGAFVGSTGKAVTAATSAPSRAGSKSGTKSGARKTTRKAPPS